MDNNVDYVLDFVIPAGATGPQGETGPTGPTGPSSMNSIISIVFRNTNSAGLLSFANSSNYDLLLPSNSTIFTKQNGNEVILNETGYYEFIFYGLLKETTNDDKATLSLNISNNSLFTIQLSNEINETYFSQTKIQLCNQGDIVTIGLNKTDSSNASVEEIYLLIKKFTFPNI